MGEERVFEDGRKRYKTFVDEYEINIRNPELIAFSKKIDKLNDSWYGEVESTNSVIVGDSPITRVNDARIKKLIANTQTVIAKYADEISEIMIDLDRMAIEKYDTDEELPEIIKLIAECFSVLHMEYLLKFKYSENNVKYEIEQSIRNIYVKWNKKFKTLPTKQLLDIEIEIKETKQKLKEAQKQEKDTIKKIESYSSQAVEESSVQLQESIDKNSTTIEELLRKNEELEVQITSIENGINEKKTEKDRLEGEIKNLKTERKNEIKQCTIEQQSISDELERLTEQKKNLENERFNLKRNEDFERNKASGALFFKKKHLALADSIASNIAEVDTRIESLNKQIEVNNLKDNDLKKKISDLEASLENDMVEKTHLIEEIKQLIDDEKDKKSILSNEKRSNLEIIKNKQADNKQNQKTIKDNNKIVKDNNNEIKWLTEVLDDAKAKTAKLEEKKNALEEEKNELKERIKQQNKTNKEKEQQDKQQVIETNNDKTTVNDGLLEKTPLKDNTVEHNMVDVKKDTSQRKGIEGLKFVVTGDIEAFPYRDDLQFFIEEHGAKLTSSVSKNTDYLITNTPDSGTVKNKKARELGVKIINEEQFFAMVGENNMYGDTSEEEKNPVEGVVIDHESIINELKKRYEDKDKPLSINQCIEENPDIEDKIRALQSQASVLFGMPLTQYFIQIDLVKNQKERYIRRYKYRDLAEAGENINEINSTAEESVAKPIQISEEKETAQIQTAKENETKQMQAVDVSEEEQNQEIEEIDENAVSDNDIMEMKEETVIKNESNQNRPYISDSKINYDAIIDELISRYEGKDKPLKVIQLIDDNPDLKSRITTLQIKSDELYGMSLAKYFKQIGVLGNKQDIILGERRKEIFDKLEALYLEHKIFALDRLDKKTNERLQKLYMDLGYSSVEELLAENGYEMISIDEAKEYRNKVVFEPGKEPDEIKEIIDIMLGKLEKKYPDHNIVGNIGSKNSNLADEVTAICLWLGYSDDVVMLKAYGFNYDISDDNNQKKIDYDSIIDELVRRYEGKEKPSRFSTYMDENPDLSLALNTIKCKSSKLYGMTASDYFRKKGLLKNDALRMEPEETIDELRRRYEGKEKPSLFKQYIEENPDLKSSIAMLQTMSSELYGMTIAKYFKQIDMLGTKQDSVPKAKWDSEFGDKKAIILEERSKAIFDKLEALYPEHKIFALDSLADTLRERLSKLYKELGYESVDELLAVYGFEKISIEETKKLRDRVIYEPGNEPDVIRNKVASMLDRLEEYYPDHNIIGSIQREHSSLSDTVSGIYQWLGYPDSVAMLKAYGFNYDKSDKGGRKKTFDPEAVIAELRRRYEGKEKPSSISVYADENPDLAGNIKTLANVANNLFGMKLSDYFKEIGLLSDKSLEMAIPSSVRAKLQLIYEPFGDSAYMDAVSALVGIDVRGDSKGRIYIYKNNGCADKVVIPYGINYIKENAFGGSDIISIVLPDGLEEIKDAAFMDCKNLKYVKIPYSCKRIGREAFKGCINLSEVHILGKDTVICKDAFSGCIYSCEGVIESETDYREFDYKKEGDGTRIVKYKGRDKKVRIPSEIKGSPVTCISAKAFGSEIEEIYIPDSVNTIFHLSFNGCSKLKKIRLSNNIKEFPLRCFENTCIDEMNIPDKIIASKIRETGFLNVIHNASKIIFGPGIAIDDILYIVSERNENGDKKGVEYILDNDSPYIIDNDCILSKDSKHLFKCVNKTISKMVIPEGIEVIGEKAFSGIKKLAMVSLPNTIKLIKKEAFSNTNIVEVNIPKSLECIEEGVFKGCKNLEKVVIPDSINRIEKEMFKSSGIKEIIIPDNIIEIGKDAFYGCGNLEKVVIPDSINRIEKGLFRFSGIKEIVIPDSIIEIGENAFYGCKKLNKVVLPDSIRKIKKGAFGSSGIKEIKIPDEVDDIGEGLFEECQLINRVEWPKSIKKIEAHTFRNSGIKEVTIPEGVEEIGEGAFEGCISNGKSDLRDILDDNFSLIKTTPMELHLPNSLKVIGKYAFHNCGLTKVKLPDSLESICEGAFKGTKIKKYVIGPNVNNIAPDSLDSGTMKSKRIYDDYYEEYFKYISITIEVKDNPIYLVRDKQLLRKCKNNEYELVRYFGKE